MIRLMSAVFTVLVVTILSSCSRTHSPTPTTGYEGQSRKLDFFDSTDEFLPSAIPDSLRPCYPQKLRAGGLKDVVTVEFVVDTTGVVDPSSIIIWWATHPDFDKSIRAAMLRQWFLPAGLLELRTKRGGFWKSWFRIGQIIAFD